MEPYAGFEPQVGEIRALRSFRVGPGGILYPLFNATPWLDGVNQAQCKLPYADRRPYHRAPADGCTCGFYAYGSEQATGEYPHSRHVLAVVACWGGVIAGTRGLRAEYSRIEALWFAETVPADLAAQVELRYPSAARYRDKSAMLREHPPTPLDCYEPPTPGPARVRWWINAVIGAAVVVSALPMQWWHGAAIARSAWGVAFAFFVVVAMIASRGRSTDLAVRRRRLFYNAIALWIIAPFAGPVGTILLRLPLVQLVILLWVQRRQLKRSAARFPADVGAV